MKLKGFAQVEGNPEQTKILLKKLDQMVQLLGGQMVARFQERAQNRVALCRSLQADALQVSIKNLFGHAMHFPRYR